MDMARVDYNRLAGMAQPEHQADRRCLEPRLMNHHKEIAWLNRVSQGLVPGITMQDIQDMYQAGQAVNRFIRTRRIIAKTICECTGMTYDTYGKTIHAEWHKIFQFEYELSRIIGYLFAQGYMPKDVERSTGRWDTIKKFLTF